MNNNLNLWKFSEINLRMSDIDERFYWLILDSEINDSRISVVYDTETKKIYDWDIGSFGNILDDMTIGSFYDRDDIYTIVLKEPSNTNKTKCKGIIWFNKNYERLSLQVEKLIVDSMI